MKSARPFADAGVIETSLPGDRATGNQPQVGATSQPLLLTALEAATMLKVELRTWRTWYAAGRIPEPVRIGRKTFWRPDDLRGWVAAGCPDRATWAVMQE